MLEERVGGFLLDGCQLAIELQLQRCAAMPLVIDRQRRPVLFKQLLRVEYATSWQ